MNKNWVGGEERERKGKRKVEKKGGQRHVR